METKPGYFFRTVPDIVLCQYLSRLVLIQVVSHKVFSDVLAFVEGYPALSSGMFIGEFGKVVTFIFYDP